MDLYQNIEIPFDIYGECKYSMSHFKESRQMKSYTTKISMAANFNAAGLRWRRFSPQKANKLNNYVRSVLTEMATGKLRSFWLVIADL